MLHREWLTKSFQKAFEIPRIFPSYRWINQGTEKLSTWSQTSRRLSWGYDLRDRAPSLGSRSVIQCFPPKQWEEFSIWSWLIGITSSWGNLKDTYQHLENGPRLHQISLPMASPAAPKGWWSSWCPSPDLILNGTAYFHLFLACSLFLHLNGLIVF